MTRQVLLFGVVGAALILLLRAIEYRFLVVEHSIEIYGALIGVLFVVLGIWLGGTLTRRANPEGAPLEPTMVAAAGGEAPSDISDNSTELRRESMGITRRELEILGLMADGLSNKEIADRLFVSENTVKTHSSRLFEKLNAKRRTQAVQIGKQAGLLPERHPNA